MNTRKSTRNDFLLISSNKLGMKASMSEVIHDIELMTDQPATKLLKKPPKFPEIDLYDPKRRAKVLS